MVSNVQKRTQEEATWAGQLGGSARPCCFAVVGVGFCLVKGRHVQKELGEDVFMTAGVSCS